MNNFDVSCLEIVFGSVLVVYDKEWVVGGNKTALSSNEYRGGTMRFWGLKFAG